MIRTEEVKSYKWVKLKENPPKNAVLYVLDPITKEVELFVTNKNGLPKPIKSYIDIKDYVKIGSDNEIIVDNNRLFVKKYNAGDEYINIVESPNDYTLTLNIDSIVADVVEIVESSLDGYELIENKQNNLVPDGTGTKYPTVDAVNIKFSEIDENISNIETEVGEIKEIIITQLQPQYFNFNNQTTVVCDHGLQKIPKVTIMIGTEEVFADIEHTPDMNTVIVTFSNTRTGIIIIQ